jgi:hypothetical protein
MRWLRRAKKPKALADYRRVSEDVHARRALRESGPAMPALSSDEVRRAVRSFTPKERLRDVRERVREFSEHSQETPRTFEPEWRHFGLPRWMNRWLAGFTFAGCGFALGAVGGVIFVFWRSLEGQEALVLIFVLAPLIALMATVCLQYLKDVVKEARVPLPVSASVGVLWLGFLAGVAFTLAMPV